MPEQPREATRETDGGVDLLFDAIGRIFRYGGELAALEVHERRRTTLQLARLTVMAWLCMLTAWAGLNASLVMYAVTEHGLTAWALLLIAALVNAACAGLFWWLARRRRRVLGQSPLQALVKR